MTDYARALLILCPGAKWSVGETYDSLIWMEDSLAPSREELEAVDTSAAPPPSSITRRQMRLWLNQAGLLSQVDALITDPDQRIEWEANEFRRDHSMVRQLSAAVGLTPKQVDQAFREASLL